MHKFKVTLSLLPTCNTLCCLLTRNIWQACSLNVIFKHLYYVTMTVLITSITRNHGHFEPVNNCQRYTILHSRTSSRTIKSNIAAVISRFERKRFSYEVLRRVSAVDESYNGNRIKVTCWDSETINVTLFHRVTVLKINLQAYNWPRHLHTKQEFLLLRSPLSGIALKTTSTHSTEE